MITGGGEEKRLVTCALCAGAFPPDGDVLLIKGSNGLHFCQACLEEAHKEVVYAQARRQLKRQYSGDVDLLTRENTRLKATLDKLRSIVEGLGE